MLLRDSLVRDLFSLHNALMNADSEEAFFQVQDEIDSVAHNIRLIDLLMVESFFDMERTVRKFLRMNDA